MMMARCYVLCVVYSCRYYGFPCSTVRRSHLAPIALPVTIPTVDGALSSPSMLKLTIHTRISQALVRGGSCLFGAGIVEGDTKILA